ncbi:MAG: VWA domain-containing protein [Acidobacteriia bacterium]|nr:VWA domain-containing protein [Terriglobia bacterium]
MSKWFLLPCLAGLTVAQTVAPGASQVQPTFRVGTRLVQLDVVVRTDKNVVRGLTKEDFTVQDKGKTQNIAVFSVTDKNAPPAKLTPLPSNVASNRMNNRGETSQSATVILFDRLNTADPADQATARTRILALLRSLKPSDKVAFYSLYDNITVVQEFMDTAEQLSQAATRLSAQAAGGAAGDPLQTALRDALTPTQPLDPTTRVRITSTAFRSIARRLSGVPGRKNLLWLTSSVPLTYGSGTERRSNDEGEVATFARILSEANIALYAVDVRGAGSSFSDAPRDTQVEGGLMPGAGKGSVNQVASQSANTLSGTQGMQVIAEETGGKAYINVNDVSIPLREVLDFAETSYTLGFYVDDKALDGKVHDLSVKIAKKPETNGAKVYARKSYLAASVQSAAQQQQRVTMTELAAEQLDATLIGVMAAALPDPSKPGLHVVQVRVSASDLQFERRGDKWIASFDLGLSIETGGRPGDVNVKTIKLPEFTDDQLKQAMIGGLDINNTVPSPSQPARLRIVVQDKVSGAAGSVRIPIGPK